MHAFSICYVVVESGGGVCTTKGSFVTHGETDGTNVGTICLPSCYGIVKKQKDISSSTHADVRYQLNVDWCDHFELLGVRTYLQNGGFALTFVCERNEHTEDCGFLWQPHGENGVDA